MLFSVRPADVQEKWIAWKAQYSKFYESDEEEQQRFQAFKSHLKDILQHNKKFQAGEVIFSKGLNQFSDWTPEEVPKGLRSKFKPTSY